MTDPKTDPATDPKTDPASSGKTADDVVPKSELERALADLHKFKSKAEKLETERKTHEEARMREQNQWKELAEKYETEAKEAREESTRVKGSYIEEKKYSAVREKCLAAGIRPEAISDLEMLDLSSVQVETTSTGKTNILGADKFAERLKTLKPHWFTSKTAPNFDSTPTGVIDGEAVTPAAVYKAEMEGRKSGDMTKYNQMALKLRQQRAQSIRR